MFGRRVPKHSPRPEAYGTVDEASSALGLARGLILDPELKRIVRGIQEDLFLVGAELACVPDDISRLKDSISEKHTLRLEKLIVEYEKITDMPDSFVLPGGIPAVGALDLARSIIRRAERRIAKLFDDGEVSNPELLSYCNRLADLLFTIGRHVESLSESEDPCPG